jgi:hypothetical protein
LPLVPISFPETSPPPFLRHCNLSLHSLIPQFPNIPMLPHSTYLKAITDFYSPLSPLVHPLPNSSSHPSSPFPTQDLQPHPPPPSLGPSAFIRHLSPHFSCSLLSVSLILTLSLHPILPTPPTSFSDSLPSQSSAPDTQGGIQGCSRGQVVSQGRRQHLLKRLTDREGHTDTEART